MNVITECLTVQNPHHKCYWEMRTMMSIVAILHIQTTYTNHRIQSFHP